MARKGWSEEWREGVQVFRYRESKKNNHSCTCQSPCEHSLGAIPIISFSILGSRTTTTTKWKKEGIPCFDEKKVGIWTTHWLFPLIISSRLYSDTHQYHWLKGWVLSSVFKKRIKINLFILSFVLNECESLFSLG